MPIGIEPAPKTFVCVQMLPLCTVAKRNFENITNWIARKTINPCKVNIKKDPSNTNIHKSIKFTSSAVKK